MSGALKKTMIYLGLADGEEYDDPRPAPRRAADVRDEHDAVDTGPIETEQVRRTEPAEREAPRAEQTRRPAPRSVETQAPAPRSGSRPAAPRGTDSAAARAADASSSRTRSSTDRASEGEYRAPVTPIKRAAASSTEGASVRTLTTVHPHSYNDAKSIGEAFRDGTPVIMNVTELGDNEAKRLVDFAAGLVFGLHGTITRITSKVFLLSPADVEVVGEDAEKKSESTDLFDED